MKKLWTIVFIFSAWGFHAQKLIDVVGDHDINDHQVFTLGNTSGMSFFDFDEDGWDDLTYPMHNDSILFYKNVNGTLTEIGSYIYADGIVRQMLWVDYDNDGNLDLCISYNEAELRLYQNDGNFNFTDVSVSSGIFPSVSNPFGFSFVDTDNDSDLDLYVCSYDPSSSTNKYYENQGDGTFIEKTSQLGIDNGIQLSFMPVWFDFNNDQNIDLHIINDRIGGDDALYKNEGGSFTDVASSMGCLNEGQNPMTSSISDYNNDGYQDIFITDFGLDYTPTAPGPFHHKLFENHNGLSFIDQAAARNVDTNIFGWGALWVDYNNDSYEDLYIATGNNFGVYTPTPSVFFRNEQGTNFTGINDSIVGDINTISFCPVKGDLNNDGFYDIAVLNKDTLPNLLLNEGNTNNYIKITPIGIVSNRMAIGSQIRVFAGGIGQLQTVFCGEQLFAQNSQHKIFGVGSNSIVDSITIQFPSGIIAKRYNVPVNQSISIYEEEFVSVNFNLFQNTNSILICPNDTLEIALSGYDNYSWSTGSSDSSIFITGAGTYYFEAFNGPGDTLYRSYDLIIEMEAEPLFQEITTQVSCNDGFSGTAELLFANPQGIDTVFWSNGESGFSIDSIQTGIYEYTFVTTNDCSYGGDVHITLAETFYVQFQTTPVTDTSLGGISIYVFGGDAPFTYVLDGDTIDSSIDNLSAGTYQLIVYDAAGCIQEETVVIQNLSTLGLANSTQEFSVHISNHTAELFTSIPHIESIEIYNMSGVRVGLLQNNDWRKNQGSIQFDFSHPSGMYMMVLNTPQIVLREKVFNP